MSFGTYVTEDVIDNFLNFFEPVRAFSRSLIGPQVYRVTYLENNGMTLSRGEETFTAYHDREARRKARKIAKSDTFQLETFRTVSRR
jgi:DNA-dependent RNA polymerase auxiliary subunit epsilon